MTRLEVVRAGRQPYRPVWELQRRLALARRRGLIDDVLLLLEHPPTYTIGRGGSWDNLLIGADELAALGAECVTADRGGDITFHGPGQLVAYLIHDLGRGERSVRRYVARLEASVMRTLAVWGVAGAAEPGYPGVWLGRDKIAALGVAVSRGVTYHGIALNVDVDLRFFEAMIPCGLPDRGATSLARELGQAPPLPTVADRFVASLADVFAANVTERLTLADLCAIGQQAGESEAAVRGSRH
ncbi:MAG TPA: lipoyl(octanoyl) transferase LipB [Thermomicrobiaceae bacterium]|nr:lipoyl(octanoyl) transferase LipB [Thermomicrobiaceae bacterium]